MKRILFLVAMIITLTQGAMAQKVWSEPVVYLPDEEATWYVDMSEYMAADGEDMYIWTWAPNNPDKNEDGWNNPSEFTKFHYEGKGIYSITLTPTLFYNLSSDDLMAGDDIFWFNIRAKRNGAFEALTGSLQAPRPFNNEYKEFINSQADLKAYPATFTYKTPISIIVNLNYLNIEGSGVGALVGKDFGNLHIHSGLNDYGDHIVEANMGDPVLVEKTKFKKIADNVYKLDMIPEEYYGITDEEQLAGYQLKNIAFSLPTTDWRFRGVTATGADFKLYGANVEPDPDPVFSYFPQKLSQLDFLTLTRQNDDASANLNYTITGGNTVLTGAFGGNRSKRVVSVNLLDGFKNETLAKIHLKVTREGKGDVAVEETDIPLVSVSEIE